MAASRPVAGQRVSLAVVRSNAQPLGKTALLQSTATRLLKMRSVAKELTQAPDQAVLAIVVVVVETGEIYEHAGQSTSSCKFRWTYCGVYGVYLRMLAESQSPKIAGVSTDLTKLGKQLRLPVGVLDGAVFSITPDDIMVPSPGPPGLSGFYLFRQIQWVDFAKQATGLMKTTRPRRFSLLYNQE